MADKPDIYDTLRSKELPINSLVKIFTNNDVTHIYYKLLSPNDNSKNQPYLAGHITDIGFLPSGEITESKTTSGKNSNLKRQVKYSIALDFSWLSSEGQLYSAPDAKFIYYPQYPEVRLSGFLTKSGFDMGGWMDPTKKGRAEGRVLFFGVTRSKKILAYLAVPNSRIATEVADTPSTDVTSVLKKLRLRGVKSDLSSRDVLLQELRRIHLKGWIESKKLNKAGVALAYTAQNGGGYTLEAELGVIPNGFADPDFMGWEIKQFGVKRCDLIGSKPLTLMTPEPDGGYYTERGVEAFIKKYGYESERVPDRMDFTGSHYAGTECAKSGLTLVTQGYDHENHVITDAAGCIALLDSDGNPASLWTFNKIMEHWKKKHAKAAYIPALSRKEESGTKSYNFCQNIRLFEGTSFLRLLHALTEAHVYYDPGIKLENCSTTPRSKRRSQFRVKSKQLIGLYEKQSDIDILA
ncbi:MAG: MvaI/BcnI family restriction endonuclease [Methylophilaceae bacterium]